MQTYRWTVGLMCILALGFTSPSTVLAKSGDRAAVSVSGKKAKAQSGGSEKSNRKATGKKAAERRLQSLPPLDLSDMQIWNWNGKWHASQWDHAFSDVPWRYNRVAQLSSGDTIFKLDQKGAPELKSQNMPSAKKGLWEVDVTLPTMATGLVVAPLWLYNGSSKDEIDFEFAGSKGLQINIHSYNSGRHVTKPVMIPNTNNWSGQRVRFGIWTDLDAGAIKMLINGDVVHTYNRSENPAAFPKTSLKPIISMWPAKSGLSWAEGWVGKWTGNPTTMIVHGYKYTSF